MTNELKLEALREKYARAGSKAARRGLRHKRFKRLADRRPVVVTALKAGWMSLRELRAYLNGEVADESAVVR